MSAYPQPHEDAVNAPLLAGWKDGKVMIQRCGACGKAIFYPKSMCPHCWSDRLEWFQASGRGKIVAWSLVYKPHHPAFDGEVPIVLVEVALDEGVAMLTRIVGEDREKAKTGAKVVAVPMPDAARYPLPTFKLA